MEKLAATNGLEYVRIMSKCGHDGADEHEFRLYRKRIVEADRSATPWGATCMGTTIARCDKSVKSTGGHQTAPPTLCVACFTWRHARMEQQKEREFGAWLALVRHTNP